jgi:hypothetical protein
MRRRFNDPIGLGFEDYPTLLALALYAWHSRHSRGADARFILYDLMFGSKWFKSRVAVKSYRGPPNVRKLLGKLGLTSCPQCGRRFEVGGFEFR